jgi:hypothetical protein
LSIPGLKVKVEGPYDYVVVKVLVNEGIAGS